MADADDLLPGGTQGRSARLIRILLMVSLALNMFFLGAGAVVLTRTLTDPGPRGGFLMRSWREDFPGPTMMLKALTPESRARVETAIASDLRAMREAVATARKARREAYQTFSATPFSP